MNRDDRLQRGGVRLLLHGHGGLRGVLRDGRLCSFCGRVCGVCRRGVQSDIHRFLSFYHVCFFLTLFLPTICVNYFSS